MKFKEWKKQYIHRIYVNSDAGDNLGYIESKHIYKSNCLWTDPVVVGNELLEAVLEQFKKVNITGHMRTAAMPVIVNQLCGKGE